MFHVERPVKIFGHEVAFYVSVIEAVIGLLVTFSIPGLSAESAGLWVALVVAVGGVVQALATMDTMLAALVGAVKALLALAVGYGLDLTPEQVGLIVAVVSTVGGGYLRTQTASLETKVSKASAGALPSGGGRRVAEPEYRDSRGGMPPG